MLLDIIDWLLVIISVVISIVIIDYLLYFLEKKKIIKLHCLSYKRNNKLECDKNEK